MVAAVEVAVPLALCTVVATAESDGAILAGVAAGAAACDTGMAANVSEAAGEEVCSIVGDTSPSSISSSSSTTATAPSGKAGSDSAGVTVDAAASSVSLGVNCTGVDSSCTSGMSSSATIVVDPTTVVVVAGGAAEEAASADTDDTIAISAAGAVAGTLSTVAPMASSVLTAPLATAVLVGRADPMVVEEAVAVAVVGAAAAEAGGVEAADTEAGDGLDAVVTTLERLGDFAATAGLAITFGAAVLSSADFANAAVGWAAALAVSAGLGAVVSPLGAAGSVALLTALGVVVVAAVDVAEAVTVAVELSVALVVSSDRVDGAVEVTTGSPRMAAPGSVVRTVVVTAAAVAVILLTGGVAAIVVAGVLALVGPDAAGVGVVLEAPTMLPRFGALSSTGGGPVPRGWGAVRAGVTRCVGPGGGDFALRFLRVLAEADGVPVVA